jgi:hypothetical protein
MRIVIVNVKRLDIEPGGNTRLGDFPLACETLDDIKEFATGT